jgi:hypothetical protein
MLKNTIQLRGLKKVNPSIRKSYESRRRFGRGHPTYNLEGRAPLGLAG